MNKQNTRRGSTQETINNNSRSRMLLSGISSPFKNTRWGSSSPADGKIGDDANKYVGMTANLKGEALNKNTFRAPLRFGFTLIELLVVVLIIGILAAVALPQYNKAVIKARFAEAQTNLKTLAQAVKVCQLSGKDCDSFDDLDINLGKTDTDFDHQTNTFTYNLMDVVHCMDPDCTEKSLGYITAAYRKEPVCLCYWLTNDQVTIAPSENNYCPTDNDDAVQTQNYNQLLGLDTDDMCWCC